MAIWIGLISGTSADAVDAAAVRVGAGPGDFELLSFLEAPLEDSLRGRIHSLGERPVALRDLLALDAELGAAFAGAAEAVRERAGLRASDVEGIGCHGQTVAHHPEPEVRGSLQLGSAAALHERTGIAVVSDFRSGDLAAGGQGAPLTPRFHHAAFARAGETRAVLNVGGFTNLTFLPGADLDGVVAFDPGPGNALLDRAARLASGGTERFDRDGARARRGRVVPGALEALLADPYFERPPPKSTGHEHFGAAWLERAQRAVRAGGGGADDVQATLVGVTVESVARAAERFLPDRVARWLACGGGTRNPALLDALRARLAPAPLDLTDAHGVPVDAVEAAAFALLGWLAARGLPGNVPAATGAGRAVALGRATPASAFRA